jgi:hypothetical protein
MKRFFILTYSIFLLLFFLPSCKKVKLSNDEKMAFKKVEEYLMDKTWIYQYSLNISNESYYYNKTLRFSGSGDLIVDNEKDGTWNFEKNDRNKIKGIKLEPVGQSSIISSFFYISAHELHLGNLDNRVVFYAL